MNGSCGFIKYCKDGKGDVFEYANIGKIASMFAQMKLLHVRLLACKADLNNVAKIQVFIIKPRKHVLTIKT